MDYYENEDPRKGFSTSLYFNANYKKWYLGADILYNNYTYTPISRVKYHSPSFSMVQVSYNFTDYFYISVAMENCWLLIVPRWNYVVVAMRTTAINEKSVPLFGLGSCFVIHSVKTSRKQ